MEEYAGVYKGIHWCKGKQGYIWVYKGIQGLKQGEKRVCKGIQECTWVNKGIREFTRVCMGIQGYTRKYKGIQGYTRVYRGIHGFTGVYKGTQGYTRYTGGIQGYTWLIQRVHRGYRRGYIKVHKGSQGCSSGHYTIHLRRPWTRAFFRPASRTVGFSLRFKNCGHVIMFLWLCGLQNTDHVMPFWLFAPATAKKKTAS